MNAISQEEATAKPEDWHFLQLWRRPLRLPGWGQVRRESVRGGEEELSLAVVVWIPWIRYFY